MKKPINHLYKMIPLLILFIILSKNINAQHISKNRTLGIMVGYAYANVYGHPVEDVKFNYVSRFPSIGIKLSMNNYGKFPVSTEINYITKGTNLFFDYEFPYLIHSLNLNYKINHKSRQIVELSAGGYWGYLFAYISDGEVVEDREIKRIDYGMNLGLERKIEVGNVIFVINPRIEVGFRRFSFTKNKLLHLRGGIEF